MKSKLITSLRLSAKVLLGNRDLYCWEHVATCNCGILACALTNRSPAQINEAMAGLREETLMGGDFTWDAILKYHCPLTGFSDHEVFTALKEAGLSRADMHDLEFLDNPQVVARMVRQKRRIFSWRHLRMVSVVAPVYFNDRVDCAHYMLAWADLLTEEGRLDAPCLERADVRREPALA
jgi:hypothetical protein